MQAAEEMSGLAAFPCYRMWFLEDGNSKGKPTPLWAQIRQSWNELFMPEDAARQGFCPIGPSTLNDRRVNCLASGLARNREKEEKYIETYIVFPFPLPHPLDVGCSRECPVDRRK